jgi:septal ring factor EnvC (AmiA/AmiB activator)
MDKYLLPKNPIDDHTDEIMHEHIQQFQKTLLHVVDDRVAQVRQDLNLKEHDIKVISKEKHTMGVQLCNVRQELDRLNNMLANLYLSFVLFVPLTGSQEC